MKTFKESALKLRQGDVKPAAKIMANKHIEQGNFKKTLDLLKFMGKKVKVDKSTEGTSKAIWTIEGTMNEGAMDQKMFDSLKKGDKVSVSFGSGIRKDNKVTLQVKSKSKSAKYNLEKINCVNTENPGGMKYTIYNRQGKFSLAQGDMGTHGADFVKESVEEAKAPGKLGPNASREDKIKHTMKIMKMYPANKGKSEKELRKGATDYIDQVKIKNKKTDAYIAKMKAKKESVEEATKWKMGDGRPRNGARIENDRFWNLPYDSLKYIAKDAGEAMKANPTARKATTGPGNWADQVADAATVMQWRKKNGIKESVELDEAIDFFKVSKELSDYAKKHGGPDKREFEKAAAYVREIGKNSAVSVQDKAGKGLNMLFKNADTDVRDRMQMILKKGGFKVQGGYVMRESTAAYGKSLSDIRNKRKNAAIKPKDRDTLKKLSDLMKKANEDSVEEAKKPVSQMTPDEKKKDAERRKAYKDFQKSRRNEAYSKPTQAEIDADKRKERKASGEKRPSASYKSLKKKVYGEAATMKAHQYSSTSEKGMRGGHRSKLVGPKGVTYVGSASYKTAAAAKGEADAYHDGYFNTPSKPNNDKAAMNRVHDYRKKHASKMMDK